VSDARQSTRDFVFRGMLALDGIRQLEHTGVYLRETHRRFGRMLAEISFAEFSQQILDGAEKMSRLYVAFFCFENSAREFISQRMRDAHGDTWWDTTVPANIKSKVANRREEESRNLWHAPRSRENIAYMDFGDMPGIILNNWADFEDVFEGQEWVKTRFGDMEKSRNVIAHNNVLEDREIDRIRLYLQDWGRIIGL
jgi:HEPN superfamily Swt1-like protein